jgi:hypothetical protein
MATLTIIPYAPKPANHNIRKSPSKSIARQPSFPDGNLRIDSSDVPIAVPPALREGAGNNSNWCQKAAGDSEATAQGVQGCGDDPVEARGTYSEPLSQLPLSLSKYYAAASRAEKGDSDNDTDDEFPSLTRLSSSTYNHISVEEWSGVQSSTEKRNDQSLGDGLLASYRSRAPASHSK